MLINGFVAPTLFKFCAPEFNILKKDNPGNTIRLGTLHGFRNEENELLKDSGEGTFTYKIRFNKMTEVSHEWYRTLDDGTTNWAHIGMVMNLGDRVGITDATFNGFTHNSWIFCVSMTGTRAGNISEAHNDFWSMSSESVVPFATYIGDLLHRSIGPDDLPRDLRDRFSIAELAEGLKINIEAHPVNYVERELMIDDGDDFPIERLRQLKASVPFLKPLHFAEEQEFRFVFSLHFRGVKISVNDNPKILKLRPIDTLFSQALS